MTAKTEPAARAWMNIDLDALRHNFKTLCSTCPGLAPRAVVKADAYGLGAETIARTLKEAGAQVFCVAEYREAEVLKQFGLPVQILGGIFDFELSGAVADHIILPVTSIETARRISDEAVRQNTTAECHLKIDTGMGRIGILAEHARDAVRVIRSFPNLAITGMYSHFPCAAPDEESRAFSQRQIKRLLRVREALAKDGLEIPCLHMAASDAVLNLPETRTAPFTSFRPGLALYGISSAAVKGLGLKPVVSLHARLAGFRVLPAGATVGYNRTCKLTRDTLTGTVAMGYADGIPLALSNNAEVLFRGRRCRVLGRISMDYTVISLEAFTTDDLAVGDEVTFIDENAGLTVEDWAAKAGTHAYAVLTGIGRRVMRVYSEK